MIETSFDHLAKVFLSNQSDSQVINSDCNELFFMCSIATNYEESCGILINYNLLIEYLISKIGCECSSIEELMHVVPIIGLIIEFMIGMLDEGADIGNYIFLHTS